MKDKAMENVTTRACQSHLESFRIQVIPGKVPNLNWLLSNLKQPLWSKSTKKLYIVWSKVHWSGWKISQCLQSERNQALSEHSGEFVLLQRQWYLCGTHHIALTLQAKIRALPSKQQKYSRLLSQLISAVQCSYFSSCLSSSNARG